MMLQVLRCLSALMNFIPLHTMIATERWLSQHRTLGGTTATTPLSLLTSLQHWALDQVPAMAMAHLAVALVAAGVDRQVGRGVGRRMATPHKAAIINTHHHTEGAERGTRAQVGRAWGTGVRHRHRHMDNMEGKARVAVVMVPRHRSPRVMFLLHFEKNGARSP